MNAEQRQYKEMFEEVRLSDAKKAKLEEAMRMETGRKRSISFKRFAVLAACTVTMLSCVCIAGAQVSRAMKEKSIKEMLEQKGDVITNEPRGEKIPNKVTPDTKEVTILVDGEPVVWQIDASQYLDENGQVDRSAFDDAVMEGYLAYVEELYEDAEWHCSGYSFTCGADEEGNWYFEAKTPALSTTPFAWSFMMYKGRWYLMVPRDVEFDETIYLTECGEEGLGIMLPQGFITGEVMLFDFTYKGEEYTVAALGSHTVEIVKKNK